MTTKVFHELQVGDYIADMHYGIEPIAKQFDVVSHITWDEPTDCRVGHDGYPEHAFFRYLNQFVNDRAANKMLYVIGFSPASTLGRPLIIAGYCYDGRRSGVILLAAKDSTKLTEADVVKRWKSEIVKARGNDSEFQEVHWSGVWYGFVIGLGRPDLAHYEHYMRLGFPEET